MPQELLAFPPYYVVGENPSLHDKQCERKCPTDPSCAVISRLSRCIPTLYRRQAPTGRLGQSEACYHPWIGSRRGLRRSDLAGTEMDRGKLFDGRVQPVWEKGAGPAR